MKKIIIDCYKNSKKVCELYPDEYTAVELKLALEIQKYQGRFCVPRPEVKKCFTNLRERN